MSDTYLQPGLPSQLAPGASIEVSGGISTMTFAISRDDPQANLNGEGATKMIWAVGDQSRLSMHSTRGQANVVLDGGVSSDASDLVTEIAVPGRAYVVLWHAIIMFLSWGLLLPFGTAISAGLRDKLVAPKWYLAHRNMQVAGLLLAFIGVIMALAGPTPASAYGAHGWLGLVVMLLGLLQPVNGFLRPGKGAPRRKLWQLLHKGSGWLALLLAGITIILGCVKFDLQFGAHFAGTGLTIGLLYMFTFLGTCAAVVRGCCFGGHEAPVDKQPASKGGPPVFSKIFAKLRPPSKGAPRDSKGPPPTGAPRTADEPSVVQTKQIEVRQEDGSSKPVDIVEITPGIAIT